MIKPSYTIIQGDSAQALKHIPNDTIDAVVTDPPYGIEFLGKDWDSNTGAVEIWSECLRILKPGGHLLAFSAARTYHHLATNIESQGFEIRDQIMWIYSSGFPKAQDMGKAIQKRLGVKETQTYKENIPRVGGKGTTDAYDMCEAETVCTSPEALQWAGWKTALKPGHEPIVMARKPFTGSTIDNIQRWGVGALNIDATRLAVEGVDKRQGKQNGIQRTEYGAKKCESSKNAETYIPNPQGRFPSNVLGDIPAYQKYFYCPKVSRRERHCGFEQTHIPTNPEGIYDIDKGAYIGTKRQQANSVGNNHPTVKPVMLMRYLIQLVTPPNSHIVDPFTGSGTTGMAAVELGHRFTGIEQDPHYVTIANRRIQGWLNTQGQPAQPTHIPAPFGGVKGCYDQGERFATRHQQLQEHKDTEHTQKDKTSTYDRLFE